MDADCRSDPSPSDQAHYPTPPRAPPPAAAAAAPSALELRCRPSSGRVGPGPRRCGGGHEAAGTVELRLAFRPREPSPGRSEWSRALDADSDINRD